MRAACVYTGLYHYKKRQVKECFELIILRIEWLDEDPPQQAAEY
jgi:hypothetical protein